MEPGSNSYAKITSWSATSRTFEIGIWIEPWEKGARYRREFTDIFGSFSSHWMWLEGTKESGQTNQLNKELELILNTLVLSHETLRLFCSKYGIEKEN